MFRALIDQTDDAIEVLDPGSLRFLDVNERACRIFGYSREELLSMSVFDVDVNARVLEERINQGLGESGELLVESVKKRWAPLPRRTRIALHSIRSQILRRSGPRYYSAQIGGGRPTPAGIHGSKTVPVG
jgi:PAS domain S-box-containing protein